MVLTAITFNSGDVLTAAQLNTNMIQPGTGSTFRMVTGKTSFSIASTGSQVAATATYGFTFSALTSFVASVESAASDGLVVIANGTPGVSSAVLLIFRPGAATGARTGNVHWIAMGT